MPQTLPALWSLYKPLGTGPCGSHHKTLSYLTVQVHSLNAAPVPWLCPASTRLQRGTCSSKLTLVVLSDAVLTGEGNSTVSKQPCLPLFLLSQLQLSLTVGWEEAPPTPTLPCCSFLAGH